MTRENTSSLDLVPCLQCCSRRFWFDAESGTWHCWKCVPSYLSGAVPLPGIESLTVGDFWRWAYSDILSNRNRSIFAEYIVGVALGAVMRPRVEWDCVDLQYGSYGIEVKSSADSQSWHQSKPSKIRFSIRKARKFVRSKNTFEGTAIHSADCYVFCYYPERDTMKVNVLDVPAWRFYVMPVSDLRAFGKQKSVSLASLIAANVGSCEFRDLKATVDRALENSTAGALKEDLSRCWS